MMTDEDTYDKLYTEEYESTDPLINDDHPHSINTNLEASRCSKSRNLIAYWLLGLTNNYAYVIMLSAAHDILSRNVDTSVFIHQKEENSSHNRHCNAISTGTILLADIIPSLIIKIFSPFIFSHVHLRVVTIVVLCVCAFIMVGVAMSSKLAILGVICASASSGLGEATFLAYSSHFHRNVISTWSSGTGAAGVIGALSYAGLTSAGLAPTTAVLAMLFIPIIMAFSFWVLLDHPESPSPCLTRSNEVERYNEVNLARHTNSELSIRDKFRLLPSTVKFMLPLHLVYIAEYLINQGMLELIYFPNTTWLDQSEQYRWFQVLYQIGVLVSRSSVNIVHIRRVWLTTVFQCLNVVIFLTLAVYLWIGSIWVVFGLILWEGLLGGAAYVNTFYKISIETRLEQQGFTMQMTTLADTAGVTIAGFLAIPLHNYICNLPSPNP